MRRILDLETLVEPLRRSTVTIGKFFAIHRGHQALIRATGEAARRNGGPSVVFTFDRHPMELLRPGTELPVIASLPERLDLIEAQGADVAVVVRLTPEFLAQEPDAFVREVLVGKLGAVEVLASDNFRFGRGARGDVRLLERLGEELGFRCTPITPVLEGGARISSSRIAACVEAGKVADAALLLGRPYDVPGEITRGAQLGRRLGFPTANVITDPRRLLPANGVYVVRLAVAGSDAPPHPGVANLGVRPTVDGSKRLLEVHVLDWDGDLYDRQVRVDFLERVRDEQRFPDLAALQAQIHRDAEAARGYFTSGADEKPTVCE
jgi:riboflavin kinase/FMN adenylyltransferase